MPPCGIKHMQIQEAIRQGCLKICELKEDRVQLRKKSRILDEEINKLETEITQVGHGEEPSMIDGGIHTTTSEGFVALLPWLWPHLIRQRNWRSTPCQEEHEALTDFKVIVGYLWTRLEGVGKPRMGGVTT